MKGRTREWNDTESRIDCSFHQSGELRVYENVVAQALVAGGYNLFYHTFLKEDGKHHHEVDFLIPSGKRICPIEVKSSSTTTHASLDAFVMKHRADVGMSVIVSTKNLKVEDGILFLPVYMMGLIDRI